VASRHRVGDRKHSDFVGLYGAGALDLSVDGTIDLRAIGAFLPEVTTGGQAILKARVTGAPEAPQLDGRIDFQRGELRIVSPRVVVSDLTGSACCLRTK